MAMLIDRYDVELQTTPLRVIGDLVVAQHLGIVRVADISTTGCIRVGVGSWLKTVGYIKAGRDIIVEGWDLTTGDGLEVGRDLIVAGNVKSGGSIISCCGNIDAGGCLMAQDNIEAAGYVRAEEEIMAVKGRIRAGGSIRTRRGITAGLSILCDGELSAATRILAGTAAWKDLLTDTERQVICGALRCGDVQYGELIQKGLVASKA